MSWFFSLLLTGVSSFVATNLDDIFLLIFFFAQRHNQFRTYQIVIGQYIGFTIIILACLPGLIGGLFIPKEWIGFLGFIPIAIGLKTLLSRDYREEEIQTISSLATPEVKPSFLSSALTRFLNSKIAYIASITVANGGDNIGIYIPLFASQSLLNFSIILVIFYLLVGIWCLAAYWLTNRPLMAKVLVRYGHKITPFVLISLGVFILVDSETYRLFDFRTVN